MTSTTLAARDELASVLATTIAATLHLPVALIEPEMPFTALGMDSLAAVELTAAIEDAIGLELPIDVLHECDDLASLTRFVEARARLQPSRELHARMRRDAILPPDIVPTFSRGSDRASHTGDARAILLTGATGFVGAYVLRTLLDDTTATVVCLVRSPRNDAADRVRRNLAGYGLWRERDVARIRVVRGDLSAFLLGLRPETFVRLAEEIDAVYHGGAAVNWVHGYDALRDANVVGTREILRFACTGDPKPVHFLSSLGVCYSTQGPRVVAEDDDMLPAIDGLHLGYAQSKCVGESLARAAATRGLPVTITRPALVSGDSTSGRSNVDDLLSRIIAGCIRLGAAPDLDWRVDAVPVDHLARALVRLSRAHTQGLGVTHLTNGRARYWRECVLWMRLCGYDIELLPYREWLDVLRATSDQTNPLYPLRPFFLRTVGDDGLTLPELYEESRRATVSAQESDRRLAALDVSCPPLTANLLDRYFNQYVAEGVIPATARHGERNRAPSAPLAGALPSLDDLLPDIRESLAAQFGDPALRVRCAAIVPFDSDDSIVAELSSWRHGACSGLFRARLVIDGEPSVPSCVDVVVKAKASDQHVLDVAEAVARLASVELGAMHARFRHHIGFTQSHLRELALFRDPDPRLRRNTPAVHAVSRDDATDHWIIVMERVELGARSNVSHPWPAADVEVALRGLAEIHSVWWGRERELRAKSWLGPVRDTRDLVTMTPLWAELAEYTKRHSPTWQNSELATLHERLARSPDEWASLAVGPRTLIHNDFNPRNLTIRRGVQPRLCAFDWELATRGLPQRDLAEFLAFILSPHAPRDEVRYWIDHYRQLLERVTGTRLLTTEWDAGFRFALCELLVDRLAMYAMVDRFRPQRFLPRVAATWLTLYKAASRDGSD